MLLKEFRMIGMASPHTAMLGDSPFPSPQPDHGHSSMEIVAPAGGMSHKGGVSKEDCCKAVLCLIECCDCPETKALLQECCEDILSRC